MLGYDVPLGGPVSRRTALRFENVQAGVSRAIETDVNLWVAKYKSGGDRSLKQTAAMWPPRVTVKRGCNS